MITSLLAIVLILIGGWILAIAVGIDLPYTLTLESITWLKQNPWQSSAVAALICVAGILLLIFPKRNDISFLAPSKWGEIRVSREALTDIIVHSAATIPQVRNVVPELRSKNGNLQVAIHCHMASESVVTDLAAQLQEQVKQDIEKYTGIRVAEVKVLVRSIEEVSRITRVR